ncbi:hypothetical protein [Mucilaginibacter celer]|uniref:Uncharacterized protein n=1 Tax=Mucilaginibacter celer TaxID=2305508 RepID=A0A494VTY4_9SPHI|nr:hypothetical protein [Mucilaginibacter celer]AYL99046.1 hypothetical protein HYN43_028900 [Mucilaginibacter celer]
MNSYKTIRQKNYEAIGSLHGNASYHFDNRNASVLQRQYNGTLADKRPSAAIIQRQEDPAVRAEFEKAAVMLRDKKQQFELLIPKFDAIAEGPVPIALKWVKNRWERMKADFTIFFNFDTQAILDREGGVSKNSLKKLQSRLNWYTQSGDGEKLLEETDEAMQLVDRRAGVYKAKAGAMQSRIDHYLDDSEVLSSGMDPKIPGRVDAIKNDPSGEHVAEMNHVEGYGPSMANYSERVKANAYFAAKGATPKAWEPYLKGETDVGPGKLTGAKFINLFGPQTVVMLENYRPPWKRYFASDVFFSQWLTAIGKEQDVRNLPEHFPKNFYRNHIDNDQTVAVLNQIMAEEKKNPVIVKRSDPHWQPLFKTQNAASTLTIVDEYNSINEGRGGGTYGILYVQIHKDGNKNFALKFVTGIV